MSESIKIVIAAGGTGGHVQPALATIQALRERCRVESLWIGSETGIERNAAGENGVAFASIQTGKLRRYLSLQTPVDAVRIPIGALQALRMLRRFRPDAVFSTGGFVSVPTVVAARLLRIPSITHEQTATVGLATRINACFATVVALSFTQGRSQLSGSRARVIVTGNPIRPALFEGSADVARSRFNLPPDLPVLYVTGGALGAHAINDVVRNSLSRLLGFAAVIHQCGPESANGDLPQLDSARDQLAEELKNRYVVRERIGSELPDVYAAAAIVIGRAGAGTVAELAALGKPSILIPLPGAGGDEQTVNARVLSDAGAAVLLPQEQLTPERLVSEIQSLLESGRLTAMSEKARACGQKGSADRLADAILDLARVHRTARA